ncbi:MAG: hypothetical protein ACLR1S_03060 [Ruminococcus bicirculans (ex Wegman et al. 2014)]
MTITLNSDYDVTLSTALLGYVGETNARPVSVEGLTVDGADRYVMTIDYGDGVTYEVDITGGTWTPTADILRSAQTVSCQIAAKKLSGDEYILVKKSRIFRLRIGAAIGDTAIPSPSVAADALDRIDAIGRQAHADMQTAVTAAETATTAAENAKNLPQPQRNQPTPQNRRQAVLKPHRHLLKRPQRRLTLQGRVQKPHVSRRSQRRTPPRYPQHKHQRQHSKPKLTRQ